jgi:DMSO/TMAO reductase YedYZ molybdopterin-dependent catalytic subunit
VHLLWRAETAAARAPYSGSIDMASALHPQTQLTTKYGGDVLHKDFGFPIRLRVATKLGFKSPKQIVAMEVTNTYPDGYWENRRYNWFSGI